MQTFAITGADGVRLNAYSGGEGPKAVLLHGFMANAQQNWIAPGITAALEAAGFSWLAYDHRGHGGSDAPQAPEAYPPDLLAADGEAVIATLGGAPYHLIGYSLGARAAVRLLARGARPLTAVLGGMGESAIDPAPRKAFFEDAILNGRNAKDPRAGAFIQAFLAQNGVTPAGALGVLRSQMGTDPLALSALSLPVLCLTGVDDADNGDPAKLAALFAHARVERTPGNHMSAVADPAYAQAIVDFLREGA